MTESAGPRRNRPGNPRIDFGCWLQQYSPQTRGHHRHDLAATPSPSSLWQHALLLFAKGEVSTVPLRDAKSWRERDRKG